MSFLSSLFGSAKSKSVIGLDIGASSLKVVQLKKQKGIAVLETYGELSLGPYAGGEVGQATNLPADKIAETLRDLLRESSVTTVEAGVSIPFSRTLLTLVELPLPTDAAAQKTMIELEARKYIPVPVSEVQLDWFVVPQDEPAPAPQALPGQVAQNAQRKTPVLLVAVHNDELSLLQSVVQGASLHASFYEIEIFSTIRSVVDDPVKPVMVIDIGASATKVYVVEHGVIALSHNIPHGGQDVTRTIANAHNMPFGQAETLKKQHGFAPPAGTYDRKAIELVFSRILDEARRVRAQYEESHRTPVASLVLTGGGAVTRGLAEYAQTFFDMQPQIADPFSKTQAPAFMRPVLEEIGPEFAVAVGIALRKLEELP